MEKTVKRDLVIGVLVTIAYAIAGPCLARAFPM